MDMRNDTKPSDGGSAEPAGGIVPVITDRKPDSWFHRERRNLTVVLGAAGSAALTAVLPSQGLDFHASLGSVIAIVVAVVLWKR